MSEKPKAREKLPDHQDIENRPRPTGRDGEQEAWENGSKDGSGSSDPAKK
jgi:hypothetical protein